MDRASESDMAAELPVLDFLNFQQHSAISDMWKGSRLLNVISYWALNGQGKFERREFALSDALMKCFDEIRVNALDHYINTIHYPPQLGGPVTRIEVIFDASTGEIAVYNDGQGIEVALREAELGAGIYTVQGIFTREFSGSNFRHGDNPYRVTGGINGVGGKLVVVDSIYFIIETVDAVNGLYYSQEIRGGMKDIRPPLVRARRATDRPGTRIRFLPHYANLVQLDRGVENANWAAQGGLSQFAAVIETMMHYTAAFVGSIGYRTIKDSKGMTRRIHYEPSKRARVFYNGQELRYPRLTDFLARFPVQDPVGVELSGDDIEFPWYIAVGMLPLEQKKVGTFEHISLINGVYLENGGSHHTMLINQIHARLGARINGVSETFGVDFAKNTLKNLLFLVDVRQIPIPTFGGGNLKNSIKITTADLNRMKKVYVLPDKFIDRIWKGVETKLRYVLQDKGLKNAKPKRETVHIRNYTNAAYSGGKRSLQCMLFMPEGNTAATTVRDILTSGRAPPGVDFNYYGILNTWGVPINALRRITKVEVGGEERALLHKSLRQNQAFNELCQVLGLDLAHTYYVAPPQPTAEQSAHQSLGDAEFAKLNYGGIVLATDQDVDGIGQISGLMLTNILAIWPNLIKRHFIKRLATPLIRVYRKGKRAAAKTSAGEDWDVLCFMSRRQFDQWVANTFAGGSNVDTARDVEQYLPRNRYQVNYYKGIGQHSTEELQEDIAPNILNNIFTFAWDEGTLVWMNDMYGEDSTRRKQILCESFAGIPEDYPEEVLSSLRVPCSLHYQIETRNFQLEFVRRKSKSAIDGLGAGQRKAFAGMRRWRPEYAKVFQVTGYVTSNFNYPYGDKSMNDTIIKMAQAFTGSNNIPPFVSLSNSIGSRVTGRAATGEAGLQPRYIVIKYNQSVMDALFPVVDDKLLDYNYEEGDRCEPHNYVPVLPYAVLETTTTTSAGWKIDVWARDLAKIVDVVKAMIIFEYAEGTDNYKLPCLDGYAWLREGMKLVVDSMPSGTHVSEICVGSYRIDPPLRSGDERVVVTQLPLKVWSSAYRSALLGLGEEETEAKSEPKASEPQSTGESKPQSEHGTKYRGATNEPKASERERQLIKDVRDLTGNDRNNIIITLQPGSLAQIGTDDDALLDYFDLRQQMLPHLNLLTKNGYVREFASYEEIVSYWFGERRRLYEERLERLRILLELEIVYQENCLRFLRETLNEGNGRLGIDDKEEAEREQLLTAAHYQKINRKHLERPEYTKARELRHYILEDGANYEYIDEITVGMKSKRGLADCEVKLTNLRAQLEELLRTTWKALWLKEIDRVVAIIEEGLRTNWLFRHTKHRFTTANPKKH